VNPKEGLEELPAAAGAEPAASASELVEVHEVDSYLSFGRELIVGTSKRTVTRGDARHVTMLCVLGYRTRDGVERWMLRLGEGGIQRLRAALDRALQELETHAGPRRGRPSR
jgi:hypothetical protein